MTRLHGVRFHPLRRILPRMPKAPHLLWMLAVGLLLITLLIFWSHSAAVEETGGETGHFTRFPAQSAALDSIFVESHAAARAGSRQ